ncbi:PPE family protein, SVP subgroup [Mycobacterium numidiamassiliense]|uniref:PPE family protein, SVP subgroup n=1 Tax=Mycobacterium numidiamassiliense TaxID=1841861 RepID=UPI00097DFECF|nr:PPE domain-containing protein [Mycobacterium numidiamassiliense]
MDFASLPPEVNSSRMYLGPGSDSMLSAAEAWEGLAAELYATASSYQSAIASLTAGPWIGPSSASMAAAAASYVSWLEGAAVQAEHAGTQAKAAAAAYEEAFASTVPPPLVTSNRTRLARLLATNVFGQNTSAIATAEAQYAEMWAQDAAAMYRYAGSSASATALTPFESPRQNTNPSGQATQSTAVTQAAGTSAGNVQQTLSAVPSTLQSLATAAPAASSSSSTLDTLNLLSDLIAIFLDLPADVAALTVGLPLSILGLVSLPFDIGGYGTGVHTDDIVSGWNGEESWPGRGPAPVKEFPAHLANLPPGTVPPAPRVSAGRGDANSVGPLSVPATWTIATPAVRATAYTMPALPVAGGADLGPTLGSSTTLGQMAVAGMAGRAIAGTLGTGVAKDGGKAQRREHVQDASGAVRTAEDTAANSGSAPEGEPRPVITGVAAELREFVKLRNEGILTEDEYTEQKNRLLGR